MTSPSSLIIGFSVCVSVFPLPWPQPAVCVLIVMALKL